VFAQHIVIARQRLGGVAQDLTYVRIVGLKQGNEFVAETVASVGGIQVGAVEAWQPALRTATGFDRTARNRQKRPDEPDPLTAFGAWFGPFAEMQLIQPGQRTHAAQARQAGASQQMHEHRLDLVIGVMCHGHRMPANGARQPTEEPIPLLAGGFLNGQTPCPGCRRDVAVFHAQRHTPDCAQSLHCRSVVERLLAANAVLQVTCEQVHAVAVCQHHEDTQENQRVGTARHAHHDDVPGGQESVAIDDRSCRADNVVHRVLHDHSTARRPRRQRPGTKRPGREPWPWWGARIVRKDPRPSRPGPGRCS